MKKSILALSITAITYNANADTNPNLGNDGSFLLDDPSLEKLVYTGLDDIDPFYASLTAKNSDKDENQDDSLLVVNYFDSSSNEYKYSSYYGSWCVDGTSCDVNNGNIIINDINVLNKYSSFFGAGTSIWVLNTDAVDLYSTSVKGRLFMNNSIGIDTAAGALIYYQLQLMYSSYKGSINFETPYSKGEVYVNNSQVKALSGIYASYSFSPYLGGTTGKINSEGNVYIDNSTVDRVMGVDIWMLLNDFLYSPSIYSSFFNVTINNTANVVVRNSTINDSLYAVSNEYLFVTPPQEQGHMSISSFGTITLEGNITTTDNTAISGFYINKDNRYNVHDNLNVFKNNTFNFKSNSISIGDLSNFSYYNFYINDDNYHVVNTGKSLITVNGTFTNIDDITDGIHSSNKSKVKIQGISGKYNPVTGDTIGLIDLSNAKLVSGETESSNINELFNPTENNTIKVGLASEAEIEYIINDDNTISAIIKTIKTMDNDNNDNKKETFDSNVKPLAEGRLAVLQNATSNIASLNDLLGKNEEEGTFTPMAKISGGKNKYGSSKNNVDSNDYRFTVGTRYQFTENFYAGLAVSYGISNYDTHNEFRSGNANGSGNTKAYDMTAFGKYTYNDFYAKAAMNLGRTSNKYRSNDIITGAGTNAKYNSDVNYISTLVGVGYEYKLDENYSFDTSVTYYYTKLNSDSVIIDGESVKFKNAVSSRINVKEQLNYKLMYMALIYENELDSKSISTLKDKTTSADAKGSTGILELGLKGNPFSEAKNLEFNVNAKGYTGKREGISASIYAQYNF